MGRPSQIPVEKKTRVVLRLVGEMSIAEAARREKISEQSIGRWKADFLQAGKAVSGSAFQGSGQGPDLDQGVGMPWPAVSIRVCSRARPVAGSGLRYAAIICW